MAKKGVSGKKNHEDEGTPRVASSAGKDMGPD